jgi:hypothetical protein
MLNEVLEAVAVVAASGIVVGLVYLFIWFARKIRNDIKK